MIELEKDNHLLFGLKEKFALEIKKANGKNKWYFRIWIELVPIGDFTKKDKLFYCYESFAKFLYCSKSNYYDDYFTSHTPDEIYAWFVKGIKISPLERMSAEESEECTRKLIYRRSMGIPFDKLGISSYKKNNEVFFLVAQLNMKVISLFPKKVCLYKTDLVITCEAMQQFIDWYDALYGQPNIDYTFF